MEISLLGLVLGLLLFLVPLYFFQAYGLRFSGKVVSAFLVMLAKFVVLGALLYGVYSCNSVVVSVLFCLLLVAVTAAVAVVRARVPLRHVLVPALAGVAVSVVLVGAWLLFAVLGGGSAAVSVARLVPVVGLVCGAVLEVEGKALAFYYMGLRNHNEMYDFFLANGATRYEALFYFRKRALESVALRWLSVVSVSLVATTPFVMWAMLLAGVGVLTAVSLQVVLAGASLCASMLSVATALAVASRYSMDGYGRLKPVAPPVGSAPEPASEQQTEE